MISLLYSVPSRTRVNTNAHIYTLKYFIRVIHSIKNKQTISQKKKDKRIKASKFSASLSLG